MAADQPELRFAVHEHQDLLNGLYMHVRVEILLQIRLHQPTPQRSQLILQIIGERGHNIIIPNFLLLHPAHLQPNNRFQLSNKLLIIIIVLNSARLLLIQW